MIPDDVEILLTHTPAYGVLDKTRKGRHAGCHVLAKTMRTLQHCRLHLHGHIHESHGAVVIPKQKVGGEQERIVVNGALDKLGMPIIVDMKH
jgi:Icc-related predicted phosphoesterase